MEKSVGMDEETWKKLSKIAGRNGRNLIGQIRFWIDSEVKE